MTTQENLKELIQSQTNKKIADFTETTPLDVMPLDSLDWIEITMRIETEYDIDVPDRAAAGWCTVGDIVNYIDTHKRS